MAGWHWLIRRWLLALGFGFVYPLLARLPARAGLSGARLWGRLMTRLDCDWRSVALREHFVLHKTRLGLAMFSPPLPSHQIEDLVRQRFQCAAEEELEGHWLARGLKGGLPVAIRGLAALQEAMAGGRGVVLLTFHFDAAIWGIGCLGRAGLRLSPISSRVVEDVRVTLAVRTFFHDKYAGLSRLLNGGRVMHHETSLRECYQRLSRGEGVVVLADASASDMRRAFIADFLGRRRAFAPGALRLAQKTGAIVAAFVCLRENGAYRIEISPPRGLDGDYESACRESLAFLETWLRAHPGRWWAADLLPDFPIIA